MRFYVGYSKNRETALIEIVNTVYDTTTQTVEFHLGKILERNSVYFKRILIDSLTMNIIDNYLEKDNYYGTLVFGAYIQEVVEIFENTLLYSTRTLIP